MVIEPTTGELVFINDILRSMVNETSINASPSTIFELGTVHDLESGDLLTDKVSDGLTQLSLDLASPSEQSANTLYFSLQPATALTDTQRLLIGGPTAPTESLPKDLNQPDELKNRILKQTAKLASESSKRATAEEKAKREAESKIKLISGAVHHLNNPMNHILGAYELVQREMMTLRHAVFDLLECDPPDPQAQELQKLLDGQFSSALSNLSAIREASSRITDTVELLRIASGIDGWSFSTCSVEQLCVTTMRRLSGPINDQLKVLKDQSGHVRFVGHPVIYGQAIDIIDETLSRASLSYESLSLEPDGDYYRLNWDAINDGSGTKSKSTELLRNAKKEVEYLLAPYGSRFRFNDQRVSVSLLANLAGSRQQSA